MALGGDNFPRYPGFGERSPETQRMHRRGKTALTIGIPLTVAGMFLGFDGASHIGDNASSFVSNLIPPITPTAEAITGTVMVGVGGGTTIGGVITLLFGRPAH